MISGGNTREANARLKKFVCSQESRTSFLPEYSIELGVQSSNSHLAEVPVRVDDLSPLHLPFALAGEVEAAALHLLPADRRVGQEQPAGDLVGGNLLPGLEGSEVGGLEVLKSPHHNEWDGTL